MTLYLLDMARVIQVTCIYLNSDFWGWFVCEGICFTCLLSSVWQFVLHCVSLDSEM